MWCDLGGNAVRCLQANDRTGLRTATQLWLPGKKSFVIRTAPSSPPSSLPFMPSGDRAQPRFLRLRGASDDGDGQDLHLFE